MAGNPGVPPSVAVKVIATTSAAPVTTQPGAGRVGAAHQTLGYLPALDGIRGLSVLAVVVFHLGHLPGGYLGVDAFFVLSGFLITGLLLVEHDRHGGTDLARFYVRRLRRLLPALLVLLVGVVVWAQVWALPGELRDLRGQALGSLLYVANWWQIVNANSYWDLDAAPSALDHMWSLAIEEQFYLVWPVLFTGIARLGHRSTRLVGPASFVLGATSAVAMVVLYDPADPNAVYMSTFTRAQSILIGATTAWLLLRRGLERPMPAAVQAAGWVAVPALALMWWRVRGDTRWLYEGGFTLHAFLVALLIAAVVGNRGLLARALAWRPLRAVGAVSYGLYLYHWPAIVWLTPRRTGLDGVALDALQVAVAATVTVASYWLIERPVRFGLWATPRLVAVGAPVSIAIMAVLIVGGTAPPKIGLERLDEVVLPTAPVPSSVVPSTSPEGDGEPVSTTVAPTPTTTILGVAPVPVALDPGERLRVAYVGDSIGVQVAPYLDRVLGEAVDFVDLSGAGSALCDWFPAMEDLVANPPHVFVIDHGGNALTECMLDESGAPVQGEAYEAKYRADTVSALSLAQRMGARTLLVDQPVSRNNLASGTGQIFQDATAADSTGTVRFFSTWPAISPDGVFVQSAECEEWEPGCISGNGEIRSPAPGVHLEPLGQFRYALAIRDDLAAAGWFPVEV